MVSTKTKQLFTPESRQKLRSAERLTIAGGYVVKGFCADAFRLEFVDE